MEIAQKKRLIWSTGLAMFAMFFGAGNIIFPLALGQLTQDKNLYAIFGLIVTAVFVPLAGLLAMLLYEGDYNAFFRRIGRWPAFIVIAMILAVIGPFGGLPRCIAISHSTLNTLIPSAFESINLPVFSLCSCLAIFLFTFRKNRIIDVLGYVLTPILLLSLAGIVVKGFFDAPQHIHNISTPWVIFKQGLMGGYNTMDLLAAFFFSSVVLVCLRKKPEDSINNSRPILKIAVYASLVAAILLTLVYISFTWLAAGHSQVLEQVASHELLGALALQILGPNAGIIAGVSVCFACLTTEIALAAVFAEYLSKTLFKEKISYRNALIITLAISFVISTLQFEGISAFLGPILQLCYPALIVLTIVNLLHKLFEFKSVKIPVYLTFITTLFFYFS